MDSSERKTSTRRVTYETGRFTRETAGSDSLHRGLSLLKAFRAGAGALTNGELAARTGLPRPTVSRLTRVLVDTGFLRYDVGERAYRLGAAVLSLADAFQQASRVPEAALPLMRAVALAGRVNVGLAVGDGPDMVYLASVRHSGDSVTRTRRVVPGTRAPVELTAIGLAYLAALPEDVRVALLEEIAGRYGDAWAPLGANAERAMVEARQRGYCTAAYQPGHMRAVATTFVGADRELYAVNISFPDKVSNDADISRHVTSLRTLVTDIQAAWQA
ncbi:IclR family transcriptional regulator [Paraburkholderia saeva]|uniref:HTH-type transcriptional regulator TsaQ1/TsaQ2 n=1 Tax=Paraburkholderia saeva TaxID=2777537 RepID=A0A9N8RSU4_9BURK|nr:IclR family transcriptional regulator [Paraburkholderia saeva]CAG4886982.1 HTH-type transcriptional regulator TsaQ1/TsaQ2 [Paraburkholderia saeva]CAG4887009.1 HTH-type transcriptional regulator TsaQ1/TsaQ2 [Paraburkholderia saeva]